MVKYKKSTIITTKRYKYQRNIEDFPSMVAKINVDEKEWSYPNTNIFEFFPASEN